MFEDNQIAVTGQTPGINHLAVSRRLDRRPPRSGDIDAIMASPFANSKTRCQNPPLDRPDKFRLIETQCLRFRLLVQRNRGHLVCRPCFIGDPHVNPMINTGIQRSLFRGGLGGNCVLGIGGRLRSGAQYVRKLRATGHKEKPHHDENP